MKNNKNGREISFFLEVDFSGPVSAVPARAAGQNLTSVGYPRPPGLNSASPRGCRKNSVFFCLQETMKNHTNRDEHLSPDGSRREDLESEVRFRGSLDRKAVFAGFRPRLFAETRFRPKALGGHRPQNWAPLQIRNCHITFPF